jgi:D-hydroxyproline dehydrogenase subunit beta
MKKYDLIIVGAGIMGSFHAFHAAKMGKKVLLLEKDNTPVGSTIQNFGQIVPSGLDPHWSKYGLKTLQVFNELQVFPAFTLVKNGSLYIASDSDEQTLINELEIAHASTNNPGELLSKNTTLNLYKDLKESYVKEALFYPNEFSVSSAAFLNTLISYSIEKLSITYKVGSAVVGIDEYSSCVKVETASGASFEGEKVIICNGYVFNLLYPEIFKESGIVVSKLQMLKTKPLSNIQLKANILTGLTIRRYESFENCPSFKNIKTPESLQELKNKGIHILFKQMPDGSIIVGDSHEYAGTQEVEKLGLGTNEHINTLIKTEASKIIDILETDYAQAWAGYYAQHSDGIFEFAVGSNIQIRTGIGGKGMTTSAGYAFEKINQLFN